MWRGAGSSRIFLARIHLTTMPWLRIRGPKHNIWRCRTTLSTWAVTEINMRSVPLNGLVSRADMVLFIAVTPARTSSFVRQQQLRTTCRRSNRAWGKVRTVELDVVAVKNGREAGNATKPDGERVQGTLYAVPGVPGFLGEISSAQYYSTADTVSGEVTQERGGGGSAT